MFLQCIRVTQWENVFTCCQSQSKSHPHFDTIRMIRTHFTSLFHTSRSTQYSTISGIACYENMLPWNDHHIIRHLPENLLASKIVVYFPIISLCYQNLYISQLTVFRRLHFWVKEVQNLSIAKYGPKLILRFHVFWNLQYLLFCLKDLT